MPELKRRTRMISLRVSEEEYLSLKQVYRSHGARSLSDFARLAMIRIAAVNGTKDSVANRLDDLDVRVHSLEERLTEFLGK